MATNMSTAIELRRISIPPNRWEIMMLRETTRREYAVVLFLQQTR